MCAGWFPSSSIFLHATSEHPSPSLPAIRQKAQQCSPPPPLHVAAVTGPLPQWWAAPPTLECTPRHRPNVRPPPPFPPLEDHSRHWMWATLSMPRRGTATPLPFSQPHWPLFASSISVSWIVSSRSYNTRWELENLPFTGKTLEISDKYPLHCNISVPDIEDTC